MPFKRKTLVLGPERVFDDLKYHLPVPFGRIVDVARYNACLLYTSDAADE